MHYRCPQRVDSSEGHQKFATPTSFETPSWSWAPIWLTPGTSVEIPPFSTRRDLCTAPSKGRFFSMYAGSWHKEKGAAAAPPAVFGGQDPTPFYDVRFNTHSVCRLPERRERVNV